MDGSIAATANKWREAARELGATDGDPLDVFTRETEGLFLAVEDLVRHSLPIDREELRRDLRGALADTSVYMLRQLHWLHVAALAGLCVLCIAIGVAGGWWVGRGAAVTFADVQMEARSAATWHSLIAWNADVINGALEGCHGAGPQNGRLACSVPLWVEAPVRAR